MSHRIRSVRFALTLYFNVHIANSVLNDYCTLIIYGATIVICGAPTIVGYILYFMTHKTFYMVMATTYIAFWNLIPCTPYLVICAMIAYLLRKTIFRKIKTKPIIRQKGNIRYEN